MVSFDSRMFTPDNVTVVKMEIQDRIRTIIKVNNLNASSFAEKIGVQSSGVSHILSGRNKPSMDFIQKVLKEFPRVDAGWLLTGVSPVSAGTSSPNQNPETTRKVDIAPKVEVPRIAESGNKRIHKIVIFYDDRSFEEYVSNK